MVCPGAICSVPLRIVPLGPYALHSGLHVFHTEAHGPFGGESVKSGAGAGARALLFLYPGLKFRALCGDMALFGASGVNTRKMCALLWVKIWIPLVFMGLPIGCSLKMLRARERV